MDNIFGFTKNNMLAVVETALFLKRGPIRFEGTSSAAIRSFWVILLTLPLHLYTLFLVWKNDPTINETPFFLLTSRYITGNVYCLICIFFMLLVFCKAKNKTMLFARCICGLNWISLAPALLVLYPVLLITIGVHNVEDVQNFSLLITFYEFSMVLFFLRYALETSWIASTGLTGMMFFLQNLVLIATFNP